MDWSTFGTALLTSVGGTGIVVLALAWLGKRWIETRITSSIQHEYDKQLETHKASLDKSTAEAIRKMETEFGAAVDRKAADRALFQRFVAALPSNGSIGFIRENNYAGFSFARSKHADLETFAYEWNNAEHEFLDPELEALRSDLLKLVDEFLAFVGLNTWPNDTNAAWSWVPPEWEDDQPERFNHTVDKIHGLARNITEKHAELVRRARHSLGVPPPSGGD